MSVAASTVYTLVEAQEKREGRVLASNSARECMAEGEERGETDKTALIRERRGNRTEHGTERKRRGLYGLSAALCSPLADGQSQGLGGGSPLFPSLGANPVDAAEQGEPAHGVLEQRSRARAAPRLVG